MEHSRDEATEAMLGDIITQGSDVVASFLNDTDALEGEGEEAGSGDLMSVQEGEREDGSGDLMPVQEEEHEDGSGDPMPVQEGEGEEVDREDGSGDHQTEFGQVYILVKPVLTS